MNSQKPLLVAPNDTNEVRRRFSEKRLSWFPVIAFLPARFFFGWKS